MAGEKNMCRDEEPGNMRLGLVDPPLPPVSPVNIDWVSPFTKKPDAAAVAMVRGSFLDWEEDGL